VGFRRDDWMEVVDVIYVSLKISWWNRNGIKNNNIMIILDNKNSIIIMISLAISLTVFK
jgi:hypothetical protein